MLKIRELYESNYWNFKGEEDYDNREEFEEYFNEGFNDCDYLFLDDERDIKCAIWIAQFDDEVIYWIPSEKSYDYNLIEEVLKKFYLNDKPQNHGFVECYPEEVDKNKTVLKYRGGTGYNYTFWQYNK